MLSLVECINTIKSESWKLHLLAINARIETLRAENYFNNCSLLVNKRMIVQAKLIAMLVEKYGEQTVILNRILSESGCTDVLITNKENIVIAAVPNSICGKITALQSDENRKLQAEGVVEIKDKKKTKGTLEKCVIVKRRDSNGYISIKHQFKPPKGITTAKSFGVVADEIGLLSAKMESRCMGLIDTIENEDKSDEIKKKYNKTIADGVNKLDKDIKMSNLLAIRAKIEAAQATNDNNVMD